MNKVNRWIIASALTGSLLLSSNFVSAATFKDVGGEAWAQDEITFLVDQKIMNGYPDGAFNPNKPITKAQAAVVIVRALNLPYNKSTITFSDVSKNHTAYKEIATVVEAGIFPKGKKFNPNEPITKEYLAEVLVNAFELESTGSIQVSDVPETSPYYEPISILAHHDIVDLENGKFNPKKKITRAEFAVYMARLLNPDFLPNQYNIPMNVNPVVKLFDFTLKDPSRIQTLFKNGNDFGFTKLSSSIEEIELSKLQEVGRLNGVTEFSVKLNVKTTNDKASLLVNGENQLYFLVTRNGYMDYQITSVDTKPHLQEDDSIVSFTEARTLFAEAKRAYWYVVSGGEGERDLTLFEHNGHEYRYMGESLDSEEKLREYLGRWYTPDQVEKLYQQLGFTTKDGKLAQPNADGGSLLNWEQATLTITKDSTTSKHYDMQVPLGDLNDLSHETGELRFVPGKGWRVQSMGQFQ